MIEELKNYFDVDRQGNIAGSITIENFLAQIMDLYAGQMIVLTVRGVPRDEKTIRAWYFSGIIPDILGVMNVHGTPVKRKSKQDRDWLHDQLKRKYLEPLRNDAGQYVDLNGRPCAKPVYTTRNLGRTGWIDYTRVIVEAIESTYGVILKPKSIHNNGKKKNNRAV